MGVITRWWIERIDMATVVRENQGSNWIAGAIKHPGALSRSAKKAGMSPMAFARAHKGDSGTTGARSRLAITLNKLRKH